MRSGKALLLSFMALILLVIPARSGEPGTESSQTLEHRLRDISLAPDEARKFLGLIKELISLKDRQKLALLVDYPINVNLHGKTVQIKSRKDFIRNYNEIITPRVRKSALKQNFEDLFVNWQGVMIGSGEIWFGAVIQKGGQTVLKIIAINN
jgi:hypothetical protein